MASLLQRLRFPIFAGLLLSIGLASLLVYLRLPKYTGDIEIAVPTPTPIGDKVIMVYVSGAVAKPGVYKLLLGNRVEDAVKAAGGATPEANLEAINLASRLRDEMHVYVPKQNEPVSSVGTGSASQKISINTATTDQLESLPGIGPVTAKRIIDYRNKNGPFKAIEDLRDLKLVNASTFEKIKDLIAP